jgi:hypothetical protein
MIQSIVLAFILLQAQTAKETAPIDLTGYWVSVVTQDWRFRMVTPAKGDYQSIPITLDAKKAGDAWDPAKDEAAGDTCKAYGAPSLMAMPTRLHITWEDDNTLRVDTDAGMQTRRFHFGNWKPQDTSPTLQGNSIAEWQTLRGARGTGPRSGSLSVATTNLRSGYLRKNGVPYSAQARLAEYFDLSTERSGDQWITITSSVDDPQYLRQPYVRTLQFKKEPAGTKWDPAPCSAR